MNSIANRTAGVTYRAAKDVIGVARTDMDVYAAYQATYSRYMTEIMSDAYDRKPVSIATMRQWAAWGAVLLVAIRQDELAHTCAKMYPRVMQEVWAGLAA